MEVLNSSRGHFTTRRRRILRKEIRETIICFTIATIGAVALVGMFIGAVIQESEKLCPVTAAEMLG